MSSTTGPGSQGAAANRDALRRRTGAAGLARGFQVHGTVVSRVAEIVEDPPGNEGLAEADGQATAVRGLGGDGPGGRLPARRARLRGEPSAVLHAGWRGLAAGILEQGVGALRELGRGGPLGAVLGPCAGACCYEVGPEVHAALGGAGTRAGAPRTCGAWPAGGSRRPGWGRSPRLGGCTICDERYFSHRREGPAAGRMAGIAWLS